jgi:curved DNA-binding protein
MAFIDYYKTLAVDKKATDADIKKAYRKLARKYHPDLNPNDKEAEKKFKEINEANEVLSNTENRKKYDEFGENWKHADEYTKAKQQQQYHGGGQPNGFGSFGGSSEYSDFFESIFGRSTTRGRGRTSPFKGQDYNVELHLDIKDVYAAHKQTLTIKGKNIRLTIPAGVENGQVIKINGYGEAGSGGGPKGDLYITFSIDNKTNFKLDKSNLYTDIALDLYVALLGGEIMIDTFDGKAKLMVKPGTQNGTKVKLKGKGFPVYKKEGQFGDLFLTFQIKIPTDLSEKEKELIKELVKLRS